MRLLIFMSLWISQITLVDGKNLRDPTEPKGAASQQEMLNGGQESLVLNAVFVNGQNKYAVINGKQYQVNDLVLGNKLIQIEQNQAVLNTSSGQKTLFINNHNIKKDINDGF